jgi:hypothetical protein
VVGQHGGLIVPSLAPRKKAAANQRQPWIKHSQPFT